MENAGIIAQAGFEFQKLAFVLQIMSISPSNFIVYEGKDDVEISNTYFPIFSINGSTPNTLIQIKSGEIKKITVEKILLNWLLEFDKNTRYYCLIEKDISVNYRSKEFSKDIVRKIISTTKDDKSIIKKVKNKYTTINTISDLEANLDSLIQTAVFEKKSIDELKKATYEAYIENYAEPGLPEIISESRFEEILCVIRNEISNSMSSKQAYRINHKQLFNIISNIHERISETRYDIEFAEFKSRTNKYNEIIKRNSDSVKQLKLVYNDDQFIIERLTEQVFYEDLRNHYCNIKKNSEINTLELLAYSNYQDVILDIKQNKYDNTPFNVFRETTKKQLHSRLFANESSNNKFYSNGCYIHLTDNEVEKDKKITWGEINEE